MRQVGIGTTENTVVVSDETKEGNGYNHYYISPVNQKDNEPCGEFGYIKFQTGPVKEVGLNGCFNEDLIVIVLDRLQCFQACEFKCRENALAITKLEEALHWLRHRTDDRKKRGVLGIYKI